MVSGDAIIQAAATMVVGVAFLVSLRQALGLPLTSRQLLWLVWPFVFFAVSGAFACLEESPIAAGYPPGSSLSLAKVLFVVGLSSVAFIVLGTARELEEKEKGKPKLAGVVIEKKDETLQ